MATFSSYNNKSGKRHRAIIRLRNVNETKSFPTLAEAKHWAKIREAEILNGDVASNKRTRDITVAEAVAEYLTDKEMANSQLFQFWVDTLGKVKLSDLDPLLIERQVAKLRSGTKSLGGKKIRTSTKPRSNATVNRYVSTLGRVVGKYVRHNGLKYNPVNDIRKLPEDSRERYLQDHERPRLLAACKASSWSGLYPIVLLALTTGARRSELTTLSWSAVDLAQGEIHLAGTATKTGKPRVLVLLSEVVAVLQDYGPGDGLVFPSTSDPAKPRVFEKPWQKALKDAGITGFRFHDLRHSTASYLVQSGIDLRTVAEILGHSSLAMVQRYSHLETRHKRVATTAAMAKVFDK